MEQLLRETFKSVLNVELPNPFPRMTYADALRRYGSDKPDLRNPLELVEVADLFRGVEFKVFAGPAADPKSRIAALKLPKGGELTRKEIDDYTDARGRHGAKGLAYIKVNERAKGRERAAVADPEIPVRTLRSRACSSASARRTATSCSSARTSPASSTKR